jgi:hypothetical protein
VRGQGFVRVDGRSGRRTGRLVRVAGALVSSCALAGTPWTGRGLGAVGGPSLVMLLRRGRLVFTTQVGETDGASDFLELLVSLFS